MTLRTQKKFDAEDRALATDVLAHQRRTLIDSLLEVQHDIEAYKRDASDAASYGVDVPFTDTMKEAMNDAMTAIADLNASAGEWSNR